MSYTAVYGILFLLVFVVGVGMAIDALLCGKGEAIFALAALIAVVYLFSQFH